ncbi:MAG: glycosyltransferase family 87 protein [Ignavibacteria bacterium]|nr:glycosyltransferase family 87 protein [Ignavibacteria bacterium]
MKNIGYNKSIFYGFLFIGLLSVAFMIAEIINGRFWLADLEVYYKAANHILRGENLYRISEDRHYIFKYSPTSALFFIPFTLLSFTASKYIYWLGLTAIILYTFYLSIKLIKPELSSKPRSYNNFLLISGLILAIHYLRELHLGQVNYLLLFVYVCMLILLLSDKMRTFSLLLAASVFIKPFGLIFLPYLVLKKKYKSIAYFLFFSLILALLPLVFYGNMEMYLQQNGLWFRELQIELGNKQNLLQQANHTIFSVIARYTPVRYLDGNAMALRLFQLTVLGGLAALVLYFMNLKSKSESIDIQRYNTISEFALLITLIPLLSFTSENAFLFTQVVLLIVLINFKYLLKYEKVLAIVSFILIGGNFGELIGRELSNIVNDYSLITFGAILLIYLMFSLRKRGVFHQL